MDPSEVNDRIRRLAPRYFASVPRDIRPVTMGGYLVSVRGGATATFVEPQDGAEGGPCAS